MSNQGKKRLMSLLEDIKSAPKSQAKGEIASILSQYHADNIFQGEEIDMVNDIFMLLAKDTEIAVRKKLAEGLKDNSQAPHDVIMTLASDEAEVAGIVLEFSKVLTDDDLISIIKETKEVIKFLAISRRNELPESIVQELFKTKQEKVTIQVIQNKTACIANNQYIEIINNYKNNENIFSLLVERGGLPESIVKKMEGVASSHILQKIQLKYPGNHSENLKTPKAVETTKFDYTDKINRLNDKGALTHSLLLRSLCEGNCNFFETGLIKLAKPKDGINLKSLLDRKNYSAVRSLCESAKFSSQLTEAVVVALKYYNSEYSKENYDEKSFPKGLYNYIGSKNIKNCDVLLTYLRIILKTRQRIDQVIEEFL